MHAIVSVQYVLHCATTASVSLSFRHLLLLYVVDRAAIIRSDMVSTAVCSRYHLHLLLLLSLSPSLSVVWFWTEVVHRVPVRSCRDEDDIYELVVIVVSC